MSDCQWITVLGATGSIGASTLDVLARHPDRYQVYALTANTRFDLLLPQIERVSPRYAVMLNEQAAEQLSQALKQRDITNTEVLCGPAALRQVAEASQVDVVMAAIVGSAGLAPTMAAAEAGKKVLLANKESLVMAGHLFMQAVEKAGATLLPIDSEHNAIFQCMPANYGQGLAEAGVSKILLTGSGGPFRTTPLNQLPLMSPDQACAHPNWEMGRKISVDSATMMNKGLEYIEACWLFNASPEQIEIVVHPQSIIHSLVQYVDGSVLAQLGNPDMRTPIAHALAWPERIEAGVDALDLVALGRLDFEEPDYQRFPCLALAEQAVKAGGVSMAVLNAANEVAVAAFLAEKICFTDIALVIEQVLTQADSVEPDSLLVVEQADRSARWLAEQYITETLN